MNRIPLIVLWITVLSIISLCPLFAQFAGGSGTESEPWQIATAEQLNNVRNYLGPINSDKHFILTANIDLGVAPWNSGEGWVPIGEYNDWYTRNSFTGYLDGDNHLISGLYINRPYANYQGLFSITEAATIKNLTISGMHIVGYDYIGGFVGIDISIGASFSNLLSTGTLIGNSQTGGIGGWSSGSLINCRNSASVSGDNGVGGVVGLNTGTMFNCFNSGIISGTDYIGGLASINYGTIDCSRNTGSVSGSYSVGGLAAMNGYPTATITNSCNSGLVSGSSDSVGGLVGSNAHSAMISNSFNTGFVNGGHWYTGGLVGNQSEATMENCFNTGKVMGGPYTGGAVGVQHQSEEYEYEAAIINCYSTGSVSGDYYTGGFLGLNYLGGRIEYCYWDMDSSGYTTSAGGEGKTTYQMTDSHDSFTYVLWNFEDVWARNNGYPYLMAWVSNITQVPSAISPTYPLNNATSVLPSLTLDWAISSNNVSINNPAGFKLWLGTDNPPTNISNGIDLGWRFTHNLDPDLNPNTTYYWRIVPYNAMGDAQDCPLWSFTTYSSSVQYPNGNELWVSGTTRTIRWQAESAPPEVKLYISFDNGNQWNLITSVAGSKGYYHFQVPVVNSVNCKIKMTSSFNESHYDISDNTFTISSSSAQPKTVITYPSASGVFVGVGQSVNITWTRQNVTNVALDYSIDDGITWIEIVSGLNVSSYNWVTPDNPTVQCRIRVRSLTNPDVCDISNNSFSISKIQVLSPNGGETITGDYSGYLKYLIRWSAPGVTNAKIEYSANGGINWSTVIASTPASSGSFLWSVPGVQTISGMIRVSNAEYAQIYDTSDSSFNIRNPIELINANGGGFITNNSLFNVRWRILDVNPSNTIYWEYSTNNSEWTRINSSPVAINNESMYWYVNTGLFNTMWIRAIENNSNRILCKSQSSFRVTDKILMIYEPNGGESYSAQSTQTIAWDFEGLSNLNISYTFDDGVTWIPIAYNVASNELMYSWVIPDTPSQTCRIKLQDTSFSYMNLESDTNFTISNLQPLVPSAVQGVDVVISGINALISWNPVTEDINGSPIVPDQYIVLYSDSPYANQEDYIVLTNTTGLMATHADVAQDNGSMFYIVVAVKFDRSNQIDVLADLLSRPGRMAWKELKGKLNK